MKRSLLIIVISSAFLFLYSFSLQSNDALRKEAAQRIQEIKNTYAKLENISMDVNYRMYADHRDTMLVDKYKGHYSKQGKYNYAMHLYGVSTIRNKDLLLVKDDSDKVILLKPASFDENKAASLSPVDLENVLKVCTKIKKLSVTAEIEGYRLEFPQGHSELDALEFLYGVKEPVLQKVILYYHFPKKKSFDKENKIKDYPMPRLEVSYENIQRTPSFTRMTFSVTPYVMKNKKGKWELLQQYSTYQLVDQTGVK